MIVMVRFAIVAALVAIFALEAPPSAAAELGQPSADTPPPKLSGSFVDPLRFGEVGGEAIYHSVCTGCHMPNGAGAVGAGAYPALANDEKLESAGYVLTVVLRGQRTMPSFGYYFSDQQVADIVNYVRSHFGNDNKDTVSAQDVAAAR
jgi:cytochrome c5